MIVGAELDRILAGAVTGADKPYAEFTPADLKATLARITEAEARRIERLNNPSKVFIDPRVLKAHNLKLVSDGGRLLLERADGTRMTDSEAMGWAYDFAIVQ
jgi:hypothetical protein